MVEDNQPWNQDRFGNHIPSDTRYDKMRDTSNFDAIENETLEGYVDRIYNWIKNQEQINTTAHIYGRKMWYTHKNPTTCWICDDITIQWKLFEVLQNISKMLPPDTKYDGRLFKSPQDSA